MSSPDDPRPRPQYGEYATPEEQRARIANAGGPVPGHPAADEPVRTDPSGVAPSGPTGSAPGDQASHLPSPRPTTTAARPTRLADRIITIALLAYGLVTVLGAIPQMIDYVGFSDTWMQMAGIDATLSDPVAGRAWGIAAAVVLAGGWLATAVLSWWSLSRRRVTWWIPLVGAIVTFVIVTACLSVPLFSDPAILDGISRVN